ncbi:MAG: RDD family protein [Proteobacteria bacterium]|nr:RDD family protein [Pseudomonadota bacterium]
MEYAGFWRRLGAGIIDVISINIVSMVFGFIYGFLKAFFYRSDPENFVTLDNIILTIVPVLFTWIYYACFHSSQYQATPGMMVFALRITNYDSEKISFWRASLRLVSTFFSWILVGIGFLMMAFTPRKQALHDYIARTLVEKISVSYRNNKNKVYAGFWKRFGAGLIDGVLLGSANGFLVLFTLGFIGINQDTLTLENQETMLLLIGYFVLLTGLSFLFVWIYYAWFQSSHLQATPGMRAFSMHITDYDGKRISFWRASGRFFSTILSGIIFYIGYLMIAFTPRKQALHDYIARTLVVQN